MCVTRFILMWRIKMILASALAFSAIGCLFLFFVFSSYLQSMFLLTFDPKKDDKIIILKLCCASRNMNKCKSQKVQWLRLGGNSYVYILRAMISRGQRNHIAYKAFKYSTFTLHIFDVICETLKPGVPDGTFPQQLKCPSVTSWSCF